MENGNLTIMSILQALMRECLGRDYVGKQSKDAFSFCHKPLPCVRNYIFP